ncbi:phage portal protein [Rhodococcus aetherivorans]|uniref:phage portal protein n=1 Tax=Rhodococcus aetherivorans TaxID=191292 RepID=UPI00388CFB16
MPKDKTPLRVKIASKIAGKTFIPSLAAIDARLMGGGTHMINDFRDKQSQLEANLGWVAAANEAIVQGILSVPIKLGKKKSDGSREEVFDHDLLDLIKSPSAVHRYGQFADLHHTYVNLTGEGYILMLDRNGQPTEPRKGVLPASLHVLPAHAADLKLDQSNYYMSLVRHNGKEYPINTVIRDLVPDPLEPYRGRSVIAQGATTIDTDQQMKNWNRGFFANDARPGMVFTTNEELSDEAYNRLNQQIIDQHAGTANAYKPLLLENGTVQPYMLNQKDLDFLSSREFSRDEILAMMRVSPAMLGMVENVNKANNEAALEIHHVINTIPRLTRFVDLLNAVLVTPYDRSYEFYFDSPIKEDAEAKLAEAKAGVNSWMTIDEVRALYGMDPLPNGQGEQLYAQGILTPLSVISNPKEPNAPPADESDDDGDGPDDESKSGPSDKTLRTNASRQKQVSANDFPGLYDGLDIDPNDLGCIMLDIETLDVLKHVPEDLHSELVEATARHDHAMGAVAETEAHVTLLYGLLENGNVWKDKVDAVLSDWSIDSVKVEEVGYFETPDSFAVIAHIKKTPELIDGHERLTLLPHIQTFSEYKPHLTLAYVSKDAAIDDWLDHLGTAYNGKTIKAKGINYGDLPDDDDEGKKSFPKPRR